MAHMSELAGAQPAYAVFHSGQLKNLSFSIFFLYFDHSKLPSKVCKACFRQYLCVFHFIWVLGTGGGGGGGSQGTGTHNLVMQLFTLGSLEIEVSGIFFYVVIT